MLSNCKDCKFWSKDGCAVNPAYFNTARLLHEKLYYDTVKEVASIVEACPEWLETPDLAPLRVEIELSIRAWRKIALSQKLSKDFLPLIDKAREIAPSSSQEDLDDDIPF